MDYKKLRAEAAEHAAKARAVLDGAKGRDLTDREIKIYDSNYEAAISKAAQADRMQKGAEQGAYLARFANAEDLEGDAGADTKSFGPQSKSAKGSTWAREVAGRLTKSAQTMGVKSLFTGKIDIPSPLGVVSLPEVPNTVLDLIPREAIDTPTFAYLRQVGRVENAAVVPDFGIKPVSEYSWEPVEDRCRVVAHLSQPIPERFLTDYAAVVGQLDSQMRAGVLRALEAQVLTGDGVGENMTGILTTSGVRQVDWAGSLPVTARKALTALDKAGIAPTAWVMHPDDAEAADLLTDSTGRFLLDTPAADRVFGAGVHRVTSLGVKPGQAILADWRMAKLLVREAEQTLAATQGTATLNGEQVSLFERNLCQLRAEGRFGFSVMFPGAFAVVDVSAS